MSDRRWALAGGAVALACLPMLSVRSASPGLLEDSDTVALLRAIRERQDPFSWFAGDWPLFNHFYRPISTLFFEWDNARWGDAAAGYGWTNLGLALACVALLFWLARELTDSAPVAASAAALFALQHTQWAGWASARLFWPAVLAAGWFAWRARDGLADGGRSDGRRVAVSAAVVALAAGLAVVEAGGVQPLAFRIVGWLPGRTASVMTVFALAAMAAYARGNRLARAGKGRPAVWDGLALVAAALALGSYEQAVMLPAALVGVAVYDLIRRERPRWAVPLLAWGLLAGYLVLRRALLPTEVSGYQDQQLRSSLEGVMLALADYALPPAAYLPMLAGMRELGAMLVLTPLPYRFLADLALWAAAGASAGRTSWTPLVLAGWALSVIAFLPMAWLKPFEHYHYWPMALRTLFVVGLAAAVAERLGTAGGEARST